MDITPESIRQVVADFDAEATFEARPRFTRNAITYVRYLLEIHEMDVQHEGQFNQRIDALQAERSGAYEFMRSEVSRLETLLSTAMIGLEQVQIAARDEKPYWEIGNITAETFREIGISVPRPPILNPRRTNMPTEQNLTPEEQAALENPSDNLTGFDMDDISIWGTKTRIEDLTAKEVKAMWEILRGYRREIIREAARADEVTRENKRLRVALKPFADVWEAWWNREIIDVPFAHWLMRHVQIPRKAFEDAGTVLADVEGNEAPW